MAALLVDRYELQRRIGSGGMATVWLAVDHRLGREVAVKILSDTFAGDLQFRERFEREARRVASLNHPNIVVVHDFGVDGDTVFIVMELVRGAPLRRALLSSRLTPEATRTVALGILAGLGQAHDSGILHRDIKPGNILLTENGSPKLADFGIAKSLDETVALTDSGAILGSVSYASPEQLAGDPLSPASDLYSLSCVLYECLAGRPPFVADNLVTLVSRQQSEPAPPLLDFAPSTPKDLSVPIMQGLTKDPERRFATTDEMSTAISSAAGLGPRRRQKRPMEPAPDPSTGARAGTVPPAKSVAVDRKSDDGRPWWRPSATIAAGVILLGALAAVGGIVLTRSTTPTVVGLSPAGEGYTPKLVGASCPGGIAGSGVHCDDLIVPQDRSHPKGRQVRLLVVQAAARTPNPPADPVLDLGSDGQASSVFDQPLSGGIEGPSSNTRLYSNYIELSRRGAVGSSPELSCPEVEAANIAALALPSSDPQGPASQVSAYAACRKRLLASGIDPNDYGDDARAADVRDLLSALHLSQVDLLAGNQETRVAYDLMRQEPTSIRSVVLEDALSPSVDWQMDAASGLNTAINAYQSVCDRDANCAKAFPDILQQAETDFSEYQQHPVTVDVPPANGESPIPILIDGDRAVESLGGALGSNILAPVASEIYSPNLDVVGSGVSNVTLGVTNTLAFGAVESEYCKDQFPDDSSLALLGDHAADSSFPYFASFDSDQLDADECRAWHVRPDNSDDFSPVTSTIPTFITTGGVISASNFPGWASQVSNGLAHSVVLTFPTLADGSVASPSTPSCVSSLRLKFLRDPLSHDLDVKSCDAQSPPIDFDG
jgi:pimeloyl-ACP methyl ester carboxylesterase